MIRSYAIFPPLVGRQRAARQSALSAAVFPLFRLWTNLLESMLYFRDEVKVVDQVSPVKSGPPRQSPAPERSERSWGERNCHVLSRRILESWAERTDLKAFAIRRLIQHPSRAHRR